MARSVIAGADVGGTKARIVIASDGESRTLILSSAPWYQQGLTTVAAGLADALSSAGVEGPSSLVIGAHGCDNRQQCERLEVLLAERVGVRPVVVNDAELLLPAAGIDAGIGLISGTGSIAVGYGADGSLISVGGWGGYVGDEGSGTGLFRDAARAAVRAYDRGERSDPLIGILSELVEIEDLRDLPRQLGVSVQPTNWSAIAGPLFARSLEAGSELAERVVRESALALAELVVVLARRGADASTVVAAGGVVEHAEWWRDALRVAFAETLSATNLRFLDVAPVEGAVKLAGDLATLCSGEPLARTVHPRLREVLQNAVPQ